MHAFLARHVHNLSVHALSVCLVGSVVSPMRPSPCHPSLLSSILPALQFHQMKAESSGQSPLLTPEQQQWVTIQKLLATTSLAVKWPPPEDPFRYLVYQLIMWPGWDRGEADRGCRRAECEQCDALCHR